MFSAATFRIAFGDAKLDRCLLIAPHGGGIEPGTSEIMRSVAHLGGWAWYEFAGFLRSGNKTALHLSSTTFDEPILAGMLPQTNFVLSFHGAGEAADPVVYVCGKWKAGRQILAQSINAAQADHGLRAIDVIDSPNAHFRGMDDRNITNRGKSGEGVQLEFSRGARNSLFPPDASREARGRRSDQLRLLVSSIHTATKQLCDLAASVRG